MKTADLCRRPGISPATFYQRKAKFGSLDMSEARRLRMLKAENARRKKPLADAMLDNAMQVIAHTRLEAPDLASLSGQFPDLRRPRNRK